ncbi:MAG: hypothetical protein NTV19_16055 [Burkholderiales bacterium]|nr:hypothetical protein [Burkholderiales bacterium]
MATAAFENDPVSTTATKTRNAVRLGEPSRRRGSESASVVIFPQSVISDAYKNYMFFK